MSNRGHGRGAIAAIGLVVLFAGLVGGVVLWILAIREPNKAVEGFARAAPGCSTVVTFSEPGEYYVFEELSGVVETVEGCDATTTPGQAFAFDIRPSGGEPVAQVTDTSITYDLDAGQGSSVARVMIPAPGDYSVSVLGSDPAVNAAIGDDPEAGVDDLRMAAIAAAAVGVLVGGLMLWIAGRRSRKAATFTSPIDPGWGVTERDHQRRAADATQWAAPITGSQVPVNPHMPDERRVAAVTTAEPIDAEPDIAPTPSGNDLGADAEPDIVAEPTDAGPSDTGPTDSGPERDVESDDDSTR